MTNAIKAHADKLIPAAIILAGLFALLLIPGSWDGVLQVPQTLGAALATAWAWTESTFTTVFSWVVSIF